MKKTIYFLMIMSFAIACENVTEDEAEAAATTEVLPAECETTPNTDISGGQEVCTVSSGAKHIRIEGLKTTTPHSSMQLLMGFDSGDSLPTGNGSTISNDQFKALFYHGSGFAPPPASTFYVGTNTKNGTYTGYTAATVTVCFDIEYTTPITVTYWVTGQNTADCANFTNLTTANAVATESSWGGSSTALSVKKNYIYQTAGNTSPTKIAVYNTTKKQ